MGTVFKKMFTEAAAGGGGNLRPQRSERFARWKDRRATRAGRRPLTVGEDGSERITLESPFYVAKWAMATRSGAPGGDRLQGRNRRPPSAGRSRAPQP